MTNPLEAYSAGYYDGVHGLPFNPEGKILPRTEGDEPEKIVARLYQRLMRWMTASAQADEMQGARADVAELMRELAKEGDDWMTASARRYAPGSVVEYRRPGLEQGVCRITEYDDYGVVFQTAEEGGRGSLLTDIEFRPATEGKGDE